MPESIELSGALGVGKRTVAGPEGEPVEQDVIVVNTSPFTQYVIPLGDTPGPSGEPSARELVKRHLNSGIEVPSIQLPGR